jgi:uncharacterized membrane protein YdbT with pleckstrin-like domain
MDLNLQKNERILYEDGPRGVILVFWAFKSLFIAFFLTMVLSPITGFFGFSIFSGLIGASGLIYSILPVFILVFILVFLYHIALRKTFKYYITNDRVVFKGGIIIRRIRSVPYHKITDASISQNIIEAAVGISKVNIHTAGTSSFKAEIQFVGVGEPERAQSLVLQELKKFKSSRHGAAISE